jgi:hypothetical protein
MSAQRVAVHSFNLNFFFQNTGFRVVAHRPNLVGSYVYQLKLESKIHLTAYKAEK